MTFRYRAIITAAAVILLVAGAFAAPGRAGDREAKRHGAATLEYREGVPFLTLSGTWYEMGYQYGALMKEEVTAAYAAMDRSVDAFFGMVPAVLRPLARLMFNRMVSKKEKTIPARYREELRGFAEATGLDYTYLVRMTFTSDIVGSLGCTSAVVAVDGALIHGRNLDFPPTTLGRHPLVVEYRPAGKRPHTLVGIAGYLPALSGMNDAGISITLNVSFMAEEYGKPVMPVGYKIRELLESASNLAEIESLMEGFASDHGWFFTIASAPDGSGVIYNIAGGEIRKTPLAGGGIFVENRFLFEEMNMRHKTLEDSGGDYNENRTATVAGRIAGIKGVDEMAALLRSTDYYGYRDALGKFTVNNYETVQSMVLLPAAGEIYFASAPMYAGYAKMLRYNRNTGSVSVHRQADPRLAGKEIAGLLAWADRLYADPKGAVRALAHDPAAGPFQLGTAYRLWQFDRDIVDLTKLLPAIDGALEAMPDDASLIVIKGEALIEAGRYDGAISACTAGLASGIAAPGDVMMLHALLAKAHHAKGAHEIAARHADAALALLTRYRMKGEQKKLKRRLERMR